MISAGRRVPVLIAFAWPPDPLHSISSNRAVATSDGRATVLGPLPHDGKRAEAMRLYQGVTVTVVAEAAQLLASSVSTTVFVASAHASTK